MDFTHDMHLEIIQNNAPHKTVPWRLPYSFLAAGKTPCHHELLQKSSTPFLLGYSDLCLHNHGQIGSDSGHVNEHILLYFV